MEVTISPDDKILVEIDHKEGVWIEDCVELSRYIESKLNREDDDYELEVGSAGIGQPFQHFKIRGKTYNLMRQKLILYEMNYHVPYCMRCTCQAQRDVHLGQHEMYISSIQSLLFQEKK